MSDPTLSDIDFKSKMAWVWTTLNQGTTFNLLKKYAAENRKHAAIKEIFVIIVTTNSDNKK